MVRIPTLTPLLLVLFTVPLACGAGCRGVVSASGTSGSSASGNGNEGGTPGTVQVTLSASNPVLAPNATFQFSASVSGTEPGQSTAVYWVIREGASGGSVDASGKYTAPGIEGTFHVVATSVADPSKSATATVLVSASNLLPAERRTLWKPGVSGGIRNRTTVCQTVDASTYGNGASDATAGIQAAINACPAGQVVQLSAGTFTIGLTGGYVLVNKGITLRGAGPGQTTLQKTNGATPGSYRPGPYPAPVIIVGAARWDNGRGSSTNLTADAVKGAYSVSVSSAAAFSAGQFVLLDELSNASWQADPAGRGQIWASPDFRVVWQRHNPPASGDDPFPDVLSWFSRPDRPTNEMKQIDHLTGNNVFFTTPIHISYRAAQSAQLSTYGDAFVQYAGVEDLKVIGGDDGNFRFAFAANCWAKNIDNTGWLGQGFGLDYSFHIEVRESYVHDAAWPEPGGGGYAIALAHGTAEDLIENCIIFKANKMMVANAAGTASVFGYNYADDGMILTNNNWIEVGLNASHLAGSHHVLFEGNYSFNWDSDKTHGNATYHTVFRNHLRGVRRDFGDSTSAANRPKRCAGATFYSYWHSFLGNVLGAEGQMSGWVYQSGSMNSPSIFLLGWDDYSPYPVDPNVAATTLRHGNFDYLTNSVSWDPNISDHALPSSMYLSGKPAFFDAGSGYTWPWVDPTGSTPLYTLPAKARFEAGTPFTQP
jgi:hypothetical protein